MQPSNSAQQAPITTWPGAFGIYKTSSAAVRLNLGAVLGGIGLTILISFVLGSLSKQPGTTHTILSIVTNLVTIWFSAALMTAYVSGVRGTKMSLGQALSKGGKVYLKLLLVSILTGFIVGVSFLLLVVPFFIVLPRVVLASYYVVDEGLGPIEALKTSWKATKGHSGKVWGIIGLTIGMALLALVLIGIYFLIMYSAAYAALYVFLRKNDGQNSEVASVAPPTVPTAEQPSVNPVPPLPPNPVA